MRVPQVTDRLKEAPAQALRAVFSGVGSVLLVADRLRHRPGQETGQGNGHASPAGDCRGRHVPRRDSAGPKWRFPRRPGRPGSQGGQSRQSQFRPRPVQQHPQPLAPQPAPPTSADSPAPARSGGRPAKATAPAPAKRGSGPELPPQRRERVPRGPTAALDGAVSGSGAAGGLPMAGYDGLTVPQLRARMRTLEPAQLRALIAYERAHAGRDEVVAMFERRLAKVEGGG